MNTADLHAGLQENCKRAQAAKQILDRIGIVKKDQLDVNMNLKHGMFILPAKDEVEESIVTPVQD